MIQHKLGLGRLMLLVCALNLTTFAQAAIPKFNMSEAVQRLTNSGYAIEDEIKLTGGNYEAIVYDSSNQRALVDVDANTGQVSFVKSLPPTRIDWLEAAKILEQQGYTVTKLENKGDHYRADVYNAQNRAADMEVDKVTGKVILHVIG